MGYSAASHSYVSLSQESYWGGDCKGVLQAQYGIDTGSLVATMQDRALVNNLAMSILRVIYPQALDVGCFSHTINTLAINLLHLS